ncbi:MAG TPA: glycosyltransferase, partial [Chloroflexota bacterium]
SFRLLSHGLEGVYVNRVYGRGLLPETMEDTKKQRFRWAFGSAQILKRYWRDLFISPPADRPWKLSWVQRLDYLMISLGWFNDVLVLGFTCFLIVTVISYPLHFVIPVRQIVASALILPVLSIFTGVTRVAWALRCTTGCSWREGFEAFGFMLALSWTAALGFTAGLFNRRGVFLRTPKGSGTPTIMDALRSVLPETLIGLLLLTLIFPLLGTSMTFQTVLLAGLLVWHGAVYLLPLQNALVAGSAGEA